MTADLHPSDGSDPGARSTRHALDEVIRGSGARRVASADDLERFRTSIWESDAEVEAFLSDVRASRNAGV